MRDMSDMLSYNGKTPMPSDIDKYWDDAVAEMKELSHDIEMKKVWDLPTVECFDMFFTGVGGAKIHAKFAKPKNITGKSRAIVMFHGYHANFPEWLRLLFFAGQGFCVAAMDCRGQSGLSEDKGGVIGNTATGHIVRGMLEDDPKKLMYRNTYLDTAQLAEIVMNFDFVNENEVYTFGGSQGGALALACASLEPGIKKTLAYCPFLCDFEKAYELGGVAFSEIQDYFLRTDPRHETERRIFERLAYVDMKNLSHRIKASVKMVTGMHDTSCPPLTQFAMFNQIKSEKEYILYPDYGHADYPEVFDIALKWFLE